MHIKYGDKGYVVDYIQSFLKQNYSDSVIVSGVYDKATHNSLVKYLELPEVMDVAIVANNIEVEFGMNNYFYVEREVDSVTYTSISHNSDTVMFMANMYSQFKDAVHDLGWKIVTFTNANSSNEKLVIKICKSRENKVPGNELISMVNKFDGTYYYGYYLDDANDQVVKDQNCGYKLAMIPCTPNTEYVIAHGYSNIIQIGICSFTEYSIENSRPIEKYETGYITKTGSYKYTTSSNAKYILVQVPYITLANNVYDVKIKVGDINFDNVVDEQDMELLQQCVDGNAPIDEEYFEVYDINGDGFINSYDISTLHEYMPYSLSIENRYVTRSIELSEDSIGTTLLVVKNVDQENDSNIPIADYNANMWMVHDKLISYILGMCITSFSRPDDISYLHTLIKNIYPGAKLGQSGIYTEELKGYVHEYQYNHDIPFAFGYLDVDTEKLILESGG